MVGPWDRGTSKEFKKLFLGKEFFFHIIFYGVKNKI